MSSNPHEVTLAQILAPKSKKPIEVPTPDITGNFSAVTFILNPTPDQIDLCQMQWDVYRREALENPDGRVGFSKFLVAWALCDSSNKQLLDPGDSEDEVSEDFIAAIDSINDPETGINGATHKRLADKAMQSFGLSKVDLEELEKNSEPTDSGGGNGSKPNASDSAEKSGSANSKTPAKSKSSTRSKGSNPRGRSGKSGTKPA